MRDRGRGAGALGEHLDALYDEVTEADRQAQERGYLECRLALGRARHRARSARHEGRRLAEACRLGTCGAALAAFACGAAAGWWAAGGGG